MKLITLPSIILACAIFCGCGDSTKKTNQAHSRYHNNHDDRPKDEIAFLSRVKVESVIGSTASIAQKEAHIAAFNQYVIDSLRKVNNWEMIITKVNDDPKDVNSVTKMFFKQKNVQMYNIALVAPIKIDESVDGSGNSVDFTYNILENPETDLLKKRVEFIQTLEKGDTVLVSGMLTHFDNNSKINFGTFYDQHQPWNIDLLASSIRKKGE